MTFPRFHDSLAHILLVIGLATLLPARAEVQLKIAPNAPWGKILKTPIFLEAPDRLVQMYPHPSTTTSWVISSADEPNLREILKASHFPASVWASMFSADRQLKMDGHLVLYPPTALVAGLLPAERSEIYRILAKSTQNEYFAAPLVITCLDLDDWFHGCSLPQLLQAEVRKLAWKDDTHSFFSDVSTLMAMAKNAADITAVMKHMTRTESLVMEIELGPDTDLPTVQAYWKGGRDRTDSSSLIASLMPRKSGKTGRLGVSHLLPPHVRRLLYAYPELSQGVIGRFPDCHWTSLNFYEPAAREYYIDTVAAARELAEHYAPATDYMKLGDVLLFRNGGEGLHSCVYIADSIVFSKNGANLVHPWVLCEIEDVLDTYHNIPNLAVDVLRKKN